MSLVDTNNNGIPDAFENRKSITEILNDESYEASSDFNNSTLVIEIYKEPRDPKKGEYFFAGGKINQAKFNYAKYGSKGKFIIIKQIIAGSLSGMEYE